MPTYFLSSNISPDQSVAIERNLRSAIPDLIKIANLEEIARDVAASRDVPVNILVAGPADNDEYIDRFVQIANQQDGRFFFILISRDISASNYKRLVRSGNADWVSIAGAPQEIAEILSKRRAKPVVVETAAAAEPDKPTTIAFLPAAGGVGNTTLIAEIGTLLRLQKATRDLKVCVVDLDFQTSHICDYLDIEPRLQIQEISENPDRLDSQLFDILISHHSTGLDVIAAPRSKFDHATLDVGALDGLFSIISRRYNVILIDLPVTWFNWTVDIIAHSTAVVLTGINTIPCLRQLSQTLKTVRDARPGSAPESVGVVINRCDRTLLGGIERRQHVESVLGPEQVLYVSNDPAAFLESANTGTPLALAAGSRKTIKEISAIAEFCVGQKAPNVKAA
jgi:pilus assembly protein CpaE